MPMCVFRVYGGLKEKEPLADIFSKWLETVDLDELMSCVCRAVESAASAQYSGYHPEHYRLEQEEKDAVHHLRQKGYVTLTPTEQMEYHEQRADKIFARSVELMENDAINVVIEICEAERNPPGK